MLKTLKDSDKLTSALNTKVKFKFKGREFEIDPGFGGLSGEFLIVLTGLMVCGKEYYDLLKSLDCRIEDDKLWAYIKELYETKEDISNVET